jgi:hypothetical protein
LIHVTTNRKRIEAQTMDENINKTLENILQKDPAFVDSAFQATV